MILSLLPQYLVDTGKQVDVRMYAMITYKDSQFTSRFPGYRKWLAQRNAELAAKRR